MFGPCFVLLYLVSFLVLQSYLYGRERWLLYFNCLPGALYSVFFVMVPWVGLQCVIMEFPDHTHLLFLKISSVGNYRRCPWS